MNPLVELQCGSGVPVDHSRAVAPSSVMVIIPALNEEVTIAAVIRDLQLQGLTRIRMVDNGSTDQTPELARAAGAEVLYEPFRGYGRACWRGMANLPADIEWVLFCDADGSDVLEELPGFFGAAMETDFVLGNRRASRQGRNAMTPAQNFGNWLATTLIRLGWGGSFSDLGPLRLIRRSSLEALQMQDRGFGWTVEMQARAVEEELRIRELPVHYRDRQGGKSKISGTIMGSFKAGVVILGTLGKLYVDTVARRLTTPWAQRVLLILSLSLLAMGAAVIEPAGDFRRVGAVPIFLAGAALMSFGFFAGLGLKQLSRLAFWGGVVGARLILLPMFPGDDIWRYLWEGMVQSHGISPYVIAPVSEVLQPFQTSWWPLINHPEIAAVYPPLAQLGFRLLTLVSPSVWLFKLSFLAADLGCCYLLQRRFGTVAAVAYAWNPLVIYSFAGGGHYDAWFLLPLIAGWLILDKNAGRNLVWGALLLGTSVALKYISLPVVAYSAFQFLRRKGVLAAACFCGVTVVPFAISFLLIPNPEIGTLIPAKFINIARSSEFIPYWVGLIWPPSIRMNWLFSIPLSIASLWLVVRSRQFVQFCERYLFTLLLVFPSVHAWYFTWLSPFAVRSRNLGTLLVSVSGFVYFWLKHREAVYGDWEQSLPQKLLLWMPLILGVAWNEFRNQGKAKMIRLVLMLKAPLPGTVKTRLAKDLGNEEAARIYRLLVQHQIRQLPPEFPAEIRFAPSKAEDELREWLGDRFRYQAQCEGDLGKRLVAAADDIFQEGAKGLVFLGGDCPHITPELLLECVRQLEWHDVVIGPARDGGYYLIAIKQHNPRLFEGIDWGTEQVLAQTLAQIEACALTSFLLPKLEDVDDLDSWERARHRIASSNSREHTTPVLA